MVPSHFAGDIATTARANQRQRPSGFCRRSLDTCADLFDRVWHFGAVRPEAPAEDVVAEHRQKAAERPSGAIVRSEPRQNEHRRAVATRLAK